MYNKNNIAIAKVASKSTVRPELQCVAFYGDRTIATDSFRAIEMSATGKALKKPLLYTARSLEVLELKKGATVDIEQSIVKKAETKNMYPNLEPIFKGTEGEKYASVKVNAEYLAEICELLKTLDPFEAITIKIPIDKPYKPVIIEADNNRFKGDEPRQKARALLMPMNN